MLVNPKENLRQIVRVTNAYASRGGERIQSTHTNQKLHGRLVPGQSTNVPLNEAFFSKRVSEFRHCSHHVASQRRIRARLDCGA
jgi:hypothetical protein